MLIFHYSYQMIRLCYQRLHQETLKEVEIDNLRETLVNGIDQFHTPHANQRTTDNDPWFDYFSPIDSYTINIYF